LKTKKSIFQVNAYQTWFIHLNSIQTHLITLALSFWMDVRLVQIISLLCFLQVTVSVCTPVYLFAIRGACWIHDMRTREYE